MSRYGMSIKPTMMKLGRTTPAYHGSKKTSISCKPRKYQGALEGLGVRVGFDGSSRGALIVSDQTVSTTITSAAIRNSLRTRKGQVWSFSSIPLPAFLIGTSIRLPGWLGAPLGARAAPDPAAAAIIIGPLLDPSSLAMINPSPQSKAKLFALDFASAA